MTALFPVNFPVTTRYIFDTIKTSVFLRFSTGINIGIQDNGLWYRTYDGWSSDFSLSWHRAAPHRRRALSWAGCSRGRLVPRNRGRGWWWAWHAAPQISSQPRHPNRRSPSPQRCHVNKDKINNVLVIMWYVKNISAQGAWIQNLTKGVLVINPPQRSTCCIIDRFLIYKAKEKGRAPPNSSLFYFTKFLLLLLLFYLSAYLTAADVELEWLVSVPGAVDFRTVCEGEDVVAGHLLTGPGERCPVPRLQSLRLHAHAVQPAVNWSILSRQLRWLRYCLPAVPLPWQSS